MKIPDWLANFIVWFWSAWFGRPMGPGGENPNPDETESG